MEIGFIRMIPDKKCLKVDQMTCIIFKPYIIKLKFAINITDLLYSNIFSQRCCDAVGVDAYPFPFFTKYFHDPNIPIKMKSVSIDGTLIEANVQIPTIG